MRKKLFAIMLALATVMTGCGGTEDSSGGDTGTASVSEGTEELAEVTLDSIKEAGVLHIGDDFTFDPYEYMDDDGNPTGYDFEIWQKIAEDLGVELEYDDLAFSGIFAGLEAGKYDVAACSCSITAERMEQYSFCHPVASSEFCIVKRVDDDSISEVEDLSGKTVGAQLGASPETAAEEFSAQLKEAGGEGIAEIKEYDLSTNAFLDLMNGNIDAVCESYVVCKQEVDANEGALEIVGSVSKPVYASFAFRKTDKELLDYVNSEIIKFKEDGTLAELQEKYFGTTFEDLPENEADYVITE